MTSSQCAFSQRKVVSQFKKWNEQLCSSLHVTIYKSYIGQTNRKRNKSALLVWAILFYLLEPEPRAAFDHATPLYTALGDTVKKAVEFTAESITSLSNLVRSFQIMLKLQTSEQTPLMWKPGETLFNKHITYHHHHIITGTTCGRNRILS